LKVWDTWRIFAGEEKRGKRKKGRLGSRRGDG
jgi:hypothetical protein